jgi:hypothetical protein
VTSIWYIAVRPFGPQSGQAWRDYLDWAKLPQLVELVTLDNSLCPSLLGAPTAEDWKHNVQEDYLIDLFWDLDYLLGRVKSEAARNVLAVVRDPQAQGDDEWRDPRFAFQGYDLIEQPGLGISALSNCGGFPLAFQPEDLSPVGLLARLDYARAIQQRLRQAYPAEHHADCRAWAIWRMER